MKNKTCLLIIIFFFFSINLFSQARSTYTISGPACVDVQNTDVNYTVSGGGNKFVWTVYGAMGHFVGSPSTVSTTTTVNNVNVRFNGSGNASLNCQVYQNDPTSNSDIYLGSANFYFTVKLYRIGEFNNPLDYITQQGTYTYSIPAVPGAT